MATPQARSMAEEVHSSSNNDLDTLDCRRG